MLYDVSRRDGKGNLREPAEPLSLHNSRLTVHRHTRGT